jgi:nucleotide-binding universal stress UspA family protein
MYKNVLVPLTGFENDRHALEAAFLAGWPFDAHIEAFRVHPEPMQIITGAAVRQFGSRSGNQELIHALERDALHHTALAKSCFETFARERLSAHAFGTAAGGVTATWKEIEGQPVHDTVAEARFHELVVLARAPQYGQFSTEAIGHILVGCGRPVLLVPNRDVTTIGHSVAIAWKESAEAARALTGAMPLLLRAKRVFVVSINETGHQSEHLASSAQHLVSQLARHGLAAEAHVFAAQPHAAAETLAREALKLGADLLIAGAYSHGRVRELVFGGFTRQILGACELPVFFMH